MKRVLKINGEILQDMLPSMPPDFEKEMREMIARMPEKRKEEPVMKKKISVGLIFALILLLITVSAVAAVLLKGKDFVDQIMAPMAGEHAEEDRYTSEEVEEILRIAGENDITLPDHIIARLNTSEDGYYKEELMRQFVKTEYGFYPSAWPLEVQHWYEEMLEACGQGDGTVASVLPEGEEIPEEEAIRIVCGHIRETYQEQNDLNDPEKFLRHMTYTEWMVNPFLTQREWYFEYQPYDVAASAYQVHLSPAGEILVSREIPGVYASSSAMAPYFISDRFEWVYGDGYGNILWNTERLLEYQKALRFRVQNEGEASLIARERHALYQTYLIPDESMISREEAIERAKDACKDFELMPGYGDFILAVCLDSNEGPAWKVTLKLSRGNNRMGDAFVEMDAKTGAIKVCDTSFASPSSWRKIVSESYWAENKPESGAAEEASPANRPTVRPDGKPGLWYSDIAPDWYWEKLDEVNYSAETASELMQNWYNTYGERPEFWPLEAQAIDFLWHEILFNDTVSIPGLPSEGDIDAQTAVQKAKAAFSKQYPELLSQMGVNMEKAVCGISYWFNQPYDGVNVWEITIFDEEGKELGKVQIHARTGEAEELSNAWEGGLVRPNPPTPVPSPTPSADGTPWFWGSDQFSGEYWERLLETMKNHGADFANIDARIAEWTETYRQELEGTDACHFFPQDLKAVYFMFRMFNTETDGGEKMILIPENAPSEEEIRSIALNEAKRLCKEEGMDESWPDELLLSSCLWDTNWRNPGKPTWVCQFHEPGQIFNTRIWVIIDSETGSILFSEVDLFGNG